MTLLSLVCISLFANTSKVLSGKTSALLRLHICGMKSHVKARAQFYPRTNNEIERFLVPDSKVDWDTPWAEYKPVKFTAKYILEQPWADADLGTSSFTPNWNELDGKIDRRSHDGPFKVDNNYPRNPIGRTGIEDRGCLGRWGPNHAADPIVTRWKRNGEEIVKHLDGKPILQFIAIERKDSHEWAIPGGMVDAGEQVSETLQREFGEEALNSLELSEKEKSAFQKELDNFFKKGIEVYKGYVDDPRNTDNAWMETVAVNFHDDNGEVVGKFPLTAGDDAASVRWIDLEAKLQLYASHVDFLEKVAKLRNAHW